MTTNDRQYDYYAFISYKRADFKWAKWIREKLQAYRLPGPTLRRYKGMLAKRLNPIFLDKTNLTPGMLEEGLKTEVQSSKYLIVICSRAAREDSKYLDEEIQFFLEGGGEPSRIIPFIVESSEDIVNNTFPLRLQEIFKRSPKDLLCISAADLGKRDAFMELIAYMHGLSSSEIRRDDFKRRVLRTTAFIAGIAALTLGALYARYRYVDFHAEKIAYYRDYVEQYGLPVGIDPVTEEQIKHINEHYTIISSEGKVRQLRHENSYGRLSDSNTVSHDDHPIKLDYEYTNGVLDKTVYRNTNDDPLIVLDYTDETLKTADLTQYSDQESEDAYMGAAFLMADTTSNANVFANYNNTAQSNIVRYLYEYDENGFVSEKRYAADMRNNKVATDSAGIAGIRYKRDDMGRMLGVRYLAYEGENGDASDREAYCETHNADGIYGLYYVYDDRGFFTEAGFCDSEGKLIYSPDRIAYGKSEYDEYGNSVKESYYGTDDQPVFSIDGIAGVETEYDDHGNPVRTGYIGTDGQPVMTDYGYVSVVREYDEHGYTVKESYYGKDDEPVLSAEGIAGKVIKYDDSGKKEGESYFGTGGEPVLNAIGFASFTYEYDEHGNQIGQSFFGTDGQPVLNGLGVAGIRAEVNENGKWIKTVCYGTEGQPIKIAGSIASYGYEYDGRGNRVKTSFYGLDGKPALRDDGYAVMFSKYDDCGRNTEEAFYGTDGKPVLNGLGYSFERHEFDEHGKVIRDSYYGTDGNPIMTCYNYAAIRYKYDEYGNEVEKTYYDTDDKPTVAAIGVSTIKHEYDEKRIMKKETYFGPDGKPVSYQNPEAGEIYAGIKWEHDEAGNCIELTFLGADGEPIMTQPVIR